MALHPRNVSLGVAAVAVAAAAAADHGQPSGGVAGKRAAKGGGATGTTITSASN